MKELFLVRGLPGSGKSTFAKAIGGPVFEADQYFMPDEFYKKIMEYSDSLVTQYQNMDLEYQKIYGLIMEMIS